MQLNSSALDQIDQAVKQLLDSQVVAFPTETVYGLGARIDSEDAIKKIFSTKERPFFDPLIVHVSSLEQAKSCFAKWNLIADIIAKNFWPGPITLVMEKSKLISDTITSGLPRVGVRWPKHPMAQLLIEKVKIPLAAPSANKFGKTSPTQAAHVKKEFKDVLVLEGDSSEIGIESTVLLIKEKSEMQNQSEFQLAILRRGAILKSDIDRVLVEEQKQHSEKFEFEWVESTDKKESPGHMKHHYMPEIPFVVCRNPQMKLSELAQVLNQRLNELPDVVEDVKIVKPKGKIEKIEFLRLPADAAQAARELYSQLRLASERKPQVLCFIQMPQFQGEMWESVFDRMYKAASLIVD